MRRVLLMTLVALAACGPTEPQWTKTESGTSEQIVSLFGFSGSDVWAVGDSGTALHFDGTAWSKIATGTSKNLRSVWGALPNDVWVVGASGLVLRWNGTAFTTVTDAPSQEFEAVRGTAANAVFFCADSAFYFFDTSFHEFTRGTSSVGCTTLLGDGAQLSAIVNQASSSSSVELHTISAGGSMQVTLNGTLPTSSATYLRVSADDLWTATSSSSSVTRLSASAPRELVLPESFGVRTGFVRSATDVWLGGRDGKLAHFDGTALTLKVAGDYNAPTILSIWGLPKLTFAAGTDGWIMKLDEN